MRNDLTKLGRTYAGIIERCYNKTSHAYSDYGGRGISVCKQWVNQPGDFFDWAMQQMDDTTGYQLDRINNDLGYSKENCRFVLPTQNIRNRRNTKFGEAWGETKSLAEWSEDERCNGISYHTIFDRMSRGWSLEDALTKQPRKTKAAEKDTLTRETVSKGSHPNDPIISAWGESKAGWEWAEDIRCRVSYKTMLSRINHLGWNVEDAISVAASKNNGIRYEGQTILYWSKQPECGVGYNTLATRLKNGESVSEAMKKRKTPRGKSVKKI